MLFRSISDKTAGWGYSVVLLLSFFATLVVGLGKVGVHPAAQFPGFAWSGQYRQTGGAFWFIYEYAFQPLTATLFGLLAFYVSSAAFRAFRGHDPQAAPMLEKRGLLTL